MAAYWAINGTGRQTQYALAHRSWLGRVVLMHTTDEVLGPGQYTHITRIGKRTTVDTNILNNVGMLVDSI